MKLPWHRLHVVTLVAFVALALAAAWPAWSDIFGIAAHDEESSHVWLVPIVVGWIAWARRERLRTCRTSGRWVGAMLAIFGTAGYLIGYQRGFQSVWQGGAVLLTMGAIVTSLGSDVFFRIFPAFFGMLFVVPMPSTVRRVVAVPLQDYTAFCGARAVRTLRDDRRAARQLAERQRRGRDRRRGM